LSWSDEFEDPVPVCRTLQAAADHILKLPKAQRQLPHWQTAVEMLIRAAEGSPAWLMMARIAMLRAHAMAACRKSSAPALLTLALAVRLGANPLFHGISSDRRVPSAGGGRYRKLRT
jgi:hypothetical protein